MRILEEAFVELRRLDMVIHQTDFSRDWLNKSPRYYSMIRSSGREPSVDALGRLAANLKFRHQFYKTSKFGELRQKSDWIYPLLRKVWTEFYHKALERQYECRRGE